MGVVPLADGLAVRDAQLRPGPPGFRGYGGYSGANMPPAPPNAAIFPQGGFPNPGGPQFPPGGGPHEDFLGGFPPQGFPQGGQRPPQQNWPPCTPHNTVENPSFDGLNPLFGWTATNGNATSIFAGVADGQVELFFNETIAVKITLTGPSGDSAAIYQAVDTCPNSAYTFSCAFLWQDPDNQETPVLAPAAAWRDCYVNMTLGEKSKIYTFADIPATNGTTTNPIFFGTEMNEMFSYLTMDDPYVTSPAETSILLQVAVTCNSPAAFQYYVPVQGGPPTLTYYQPTMYIDNCNLLPLDGVMSSRSSEPASAAKRDLKRRNQPSAPPAPPQNGGGGFFGFPGPPPPGQFPPGGPQQGPQFGPPQGPQQGGQFGPQQGGQFGPQQGPQQGPPPGFNPGFSPGGPPGSLTFGAQPKGPERFPPPGFPPGPPHPGPPPPPPQICTPWNSVLNPQFDDSNPLDHWNVSNVVETGYVQGVGYFDPFYFNTGTTPGPAAAMHLSAIGPDSASLWQSVEVCPFARYTFDLEFLWTRTDYEGFVATNSAAQNCFLILELGHGPRKVTKTYPFGTLTNILPYAPTPDTYAKVSLGSHYEVGPEDRTILNITVSCTSGFSSLTGYQPSPFIDDVNLRWL